MRKCIVTDLDGTLWAGIAGEGSAVLTDVHLALQGMLLVLRDRGILLAVASQNNANDVMPGPLNNGPLTQEHLSAWRINWNDKATQLIQIADELHIGLDALVFLDDSPVQREWVRNRLPDVLVPNLPEDPTDWPRIIANLPELQPDSITSEDRARADLYAVERQRVQLARALSWSEYVETLRLVVQVSKAQEADLERIGQLVRKVNQFNLCANRRADYGLKLLIPNTYVARVTDRFGDYGLVGVAIVLGDRLDTFLLSCRAIGRGIEHTYLRRIIEMSGLDTLHAWYVPTPRNSPCASFLPDFGFVEEDNHWIWRK